MLRISIPVETGNKAFREGALNKIMMETIERLKPEAAYFFPEKGIRTAMMVFDLKDVRYACHYRTPFCHTDRPFLGLMNVASLQQARIIAKGETCTIFNILYPNCCKMPLGIQRLLFKLT